MGRKVKIKVKRSHIKFSGSLTQQNYGEDIKKGFLIWDIKSKTEWNSKFVPLQPVYPFITLEFENIDNINIEDYSFIPANARIRLKFLKEFDSRKIDKLAHTFKHKFNAKEITTVNDIKSDISSVIINSKSIKLKDLRNELVQEQLIQNYLTKLSVNKEHIDRIIKINSKHNAKLTKNEELARNIDWKIKSLTFSNMYAFKENNSINFEKLKGIVGIFGQNTIGKSSIIDIILYGIFNNNSKGIVKNLNIINTRKKKCSVKLNLEVNKTQYVIDRATTKLTAGKRSKGVYDHARTDLDFYKIEDCKQISLNGIQRSDTEKIIRRLFGTSDDFLTSCVAAQGDMNYFIEQRSTKRKEIIGKFLDLDIFEDKYRLAKEEYNLYNTQLKVLKDKNYEKLIADSREQEQKLKQTHALKKQYRDNNKNTLQKLRYELTQLNSKYERVKSVDTYYVMCNRISDLLVKKDKLNNELNNLFIKESTLNEKSFNTNDDLQARSEKIELKLNKLRDSLTTLNDLQSKENQTNIIHEQLQKSIKLLDNIPCGDQYPNCKFIKDSYASKNSINDYKAQLNELQNNIELLNKDLVLNKIDKLTLDKNTTENNIKEKNKLKSNIQVITLHIKNKKLEIQNVSNQLSSLENNKQQLENLNIHKLDSQKTKEQIENVTQKISNVENDIKKYDRELTSLSQQQGEIKSIIRNLINESKNYKKLSTICAGYEKIIV